jgi:hypothetical protein
MYNLGYMFSDVWLVLVFHLGNYSRGGLIVGYGGNAVAKDVPAATFAVVAQF